MKVSHLESLGIDWVYLESRYSERSEGTVVDGAYESEASGATEMLEAKEQRILQSGGRRA